MSAAAFDALVAAYEPGPAGLRALVSVAGRPLVEHQLRRAAAAGAGELMLLVDELPVALAEVVARLRHDGLAVECFAGLDLVAQRLAPERPLLLLADGCLADEAVLATVTTDPAPQLATVPDAPATARFERMDATTRWAGVALLDGARVAAAAAMLGSWDPVSTLLRRAVQEGAARVDVSADAPVLLLDPAELALAEAAIVSGARARARDWVERWLEAPLLRLAVPRLLERAVPPDALAAPAVLVALLAGGLALAGWGLVALLLLLLVRLPLAAGRQLARVADRPLVAVRLVAAAAVAGPAVALGALASAVARGTGQWGWLLVAAAVAGGQGLAAWLRPLVRANPPLWLPRPGPLLWLLLPFALGGRWAWGLAALAAYAVTGIAWWQRALVEQAAPRGGLVPCWRVRRRAVAARAPAA